MTERKSFKRQVRARMERTGERYTAARSKLVAQQASARRTDGQDVSDAAIQRATGRTREAWHALLDAWGAVERTHREIARHLEAEHEVDGWWAQMITVDYERARGLREKHEQPDGYAISASKTVPVPVERLWRAVVDPGERARWLTDGTLTERTAKPHSSARFDWEDGRTRVACWFTAKGDAKSAVSVQHERLAGADEATAAKAAWQTRLARLTELLADEPR